jgi:cytochrome P450
MPSAVEEILRWTTATLYNRRTATRPAELGGQAVAAGDKVTLWWPSANRDELVFDRPFRFDITRDPNPHLTFGHGPHFCLGANLARLEIRVMLGEVLDRLEGFELRGPVERVRTNKHAGVSHVPLAFRPRSGRR